MPDTGLASRTGRSSPYHADLDTPLLEIGGEVWDIRSACQAILIQGAPGSGKSSSSAKMIRRACLAAGMGGIFMCAKVDEAKTLIADIEAAGRLDDLVRIDASGGERFNILDYAAATLGGPGFEGNIVEVMRRMSEAAQVAGDKGAASKDGEGKFFVDGAMKWLSHAFPLLLVAEGTIRLADLNRFITTLPNSKEELRTPAWQAGYCAKVHQAVAAKSQESSPAGAYALQVVNEHGIFFLTEVAGLDNRPRSSIAATLTNLINPFLSGKLAELFCTHTTITPDACRDGKLIVLDLPTLKYGAMGAVAQSLFKYLFGMSMQNKEATADTRPVMLYMDECQNFLSSADADLLATSRGAKVVPVFITQDQPTFFAKMDEQSAKSLLGKFGTRIFHRNLSYDTNLAAAELIGKVQKFHVNETTGATRTTGGGGGLQDRESTSQRQDSMTQNEGRSSSGYMDYEVPPDHFATKLRIGTPRNNLKVDGIVVRGDRNWKRTGRHWIQAEFSQK